MHKALLAQFTPVSLLCLVLRPNFKVRVGWGISDTVSPLELLKTLPTQLSTVRKVQQLAQHSESQVSRSAEFLQRLCRQPKVQAWAR